MAGKKSLWNNPDIAKLKKMKKFKGGGEVEAQILAQKDGKAIYTSKEQYDKGKIIAEDAENVTVQIPKNLDLSTFLSGTFTEADYNKYGYGNLLNKWNLGSEVTIPKELHDGEGKDTTFVAVNPIKHKFTKPISFDFPVKNGRSKK